jgi:hypothetical protein
MVVDDGDQRRGVRQNLRSWRGVGILLFTLLVMANLAIRIAERIGNVDKYLSDQFGTIGCAAFGIMFGVVGVSKHWRKSQRVQLVRGVLLALCCGSAIWAAMALIKPIWIPNDLLELPIILLTPLSLWLQGFDQQEPSQETSTLQQSDQG